MRNSEKKQLMNLLVKRLPNQKNELNKIINDNYEIEIYNLIKIYKDMDVNFDSEILGNMDEVIAYCAFYKVFKGIVPLATISEAVIEYYDRRMKGYGEKFWCSLNIEMFSEKNINEIREAALYSQKNVYKEDYLVYFMEGDGTYTFGNNTIRCPIHIFCKKAQIFEFLATLCSLDYIRSKYMKSGLTREKCLCNPDDEMCTFRWKNNM